MKRFLSLEQMCDMIAVSRSRYYEMLDPKNQYYDPELPKPYNVYGDSKRRFYSEDVEAYVESKMKNSVRAA